MFDVITENVRVEPPRCILYANDIVLVAESRRQLEMELERWRSALEGRGMIISRTKTEYFTTDVSGDQHAIIEEECLTTWDQWWMKTKKEKK